MFAISSRIRERLILSIRCFRLLVDTQATRVKLVRLNYGSELTGIQIARGSDSPQPGQSKERFRSPNVASRSHFGHRDNSDPLGMAETFASSVELTNNPATRPIKTPAAPPRVMSTDAITGANMNKPKRPVPHSASLGLADPLSYLGSMARHRAMKHT